MASNCPLAGSGPSLPARSPASQLEEGGRGRVGERWSEGVKVREKQKRGRKVKGRKVKDSRQQNTKRSHTKQKRQLVCTYMKQELVSENVTNFEGVEVLQSVL